jgi:single-stranded-DNA-specific exonuclease
MLSIICLSHREDVDGILSAALIKAVFKTKKTQTVLTDYANMLSKLQKISNMASDFHGSSATTFDSDSSPLENATNYSSASGEMSADSSLSTKGNESKTDNRNRKSKPKRLFICDLGISKKTQDRFVGLVKDIISKGIKVTYIDHHEIDDGIRKELKKSGATLIHSVGECTSVHIYYKYKHKLSSHAAFFAASAALTDYMECRPRASVLMSRWDRQFLMLEATALSYMISSNQNNDEFLTKVVDTLSKMKYPHDIEGGFAIAERYAIKVAEGVRAVQGAIATKKHVAYTPSISDLSASVIVNFVLGISEKPVAMVYRLKAEINSYVISIRASNACKVHLGRIVNEVASNMGGSGGGHEKACGAMVPKDKLEEFIDTIDMQVAA